MSTDPNDEPDARRALLDAAKALLPQRPSSTVTGRELAVAAGVNYGLVHHYFGGKDAAFREALLELRADFLARHNIASLLETLHSGEPFLRAVGLSQTDYPRALGAVDDFPAGEAMVTAVGERLSASREGPQRDVGDEARARVMAMMCLQLGRALFGELLHAVASVEPDSAASIEAELARLYRDISGAEPGDRTVTG